MNVTRNDKPWLFDEFRKVWHEDESMINYCIKRASAFMVFDDATVVILDKPSIETEFCYGYGLQIQTDYDEAHDMADYAANSVEYFINRNLESTDAYNVMHNIEEMFPFEPWLDKQHYISQDADCKLGEVRWEHWHKRDWCKRQGWRRLTDDELHVLYRICFEEQMKFCKRLKTYLKRYGLSKVRTWTYWADE